MIIKLKFLLSLFIKKNYIQVIFINFIILII